MKSKNIDKVRKGVYETLESFRGKGITGAEVAMGMWEASGINLVHDILKQGYRLFTPDGEEILLEQINDIQEQMETIHHTGKDEKPKCFGTKKVRVRKGVSRYDCVLCTWELPCMKKYKERRKERDKRRKKKRKKK